MLVEDQQMLVHITNSVCKKYKVLRTLKESVQSKYLLLKFCQKYFIYQFDKTLFHILYGRTSL